MSKIESEGLLLGESITLASALHQVEELSCAVQRDGTWLFTWGPVEGAESYEIHTTPDAGRSNGWAVAARTTAPEWSCAAPAAPENWIRVRAVGVTGAGPWCHPLVIKNRGTSARMAA
jgi:hypothetical protein